MPYKLVYTYCNIRQNQTGIAYCLGRDKWLTALNNQICANQISVQALILFCSIEKGWLMFEIQKTHDKSKIWNLPYIEIMKLCLVVVVLLCLHQTHSSLLTANLPLDCTNLLPAYPIPINTQLLITPKPVTILPIIALPNTFVLSLQWACREGVSFKSCQGSVLWNNAVILSIRPTDYELHTSEVQVRAVVGKNVLELRGEGISDSFGLTVDNLQVLRKGSGQNIVTNGNFEKPWTNGGWNYLSNIEGWAADEIEVGAGKIYNCRWNSQVCELDGSHNDVIRQYFNFDFEYNLIQSGCNCQ